MHIGILQTGHAPAEVIPYLGDYADMMERMLADRGFTFRTWNVVEMDFPNSVDAADGWLITGSRHGVYEDHMFIEPLEKAIQLVYLSGKPLVGICFGHQIIAQALGGTVGKSDKGWGVGIQKYAYGNEVVTLNTWHQDQVITPPTMASTVASNKFCEHAALLYGDRIFTVQAHPEFENKMIQALLHLRSEGIPRERLVYAQTRIEAENDNARLADDIGDFFLLDRSEAAEATE